jgi:hypothetical protein
VIACVAHVEPDLPGLCIPSLVFADRIEAILMAMTIRLIRMENFTVLVFGLVVLGIVLICSIFGIPLTGSVLIRLTGLAGM